MTDKAKTPGAAFRFEGFYFERQSQSLETKKTPSRSEPGISLTWDWRNLSERVFEVRVAIEVTPAQGIPQVLEVAIVGRFRAMGRYDAPAVENFAAVNAVAILLPYAREALTALSVRGPFGPFILPLMNVVEASKVFSRSQATGARQLRRKTKKLAAGE